ncbi:MAG: ABC-F family ATP-binding cassette domain-containing protein [Candidatus Woesearchaeota archaeon]|jgi:ATP-binding cassette subfamily F protein 3|nr:ABC-F family ATP-binding cassette domain-containing protein [Candidatus Woesearchaeota archaeon]
MSKELILRVKGFEKTFGSDVLFENSELIIHKGDKVALLGQNGTGKSTFVKCMVGEEEYEGVVELNTDITIAIMEQEKVFEQTELTFHDYLENKKNKLSVKKEAIEAQFGDPNIYDDMDLYEKLLSEHAKISIRQELNIDDNVIREILEEINFEMQDFNKKICDLSGGQRTKLRLAEVLSKDVEFTILDEPTNHLDFETIRWLEKRIFYSKKSFMSISHDRYFVNLVSNRIVEIENKHFEVYDCDYVDYLKKRKLHHTQLKNKHHAITKEKTKLKESEMQKREWAHLVGSKKMKVQADRLQKKAEDLGDPPNPDDFTDEFKLKFEEGSFIGNMIAKGNDIDKSFGAIEILENASFDIKNGEKIAIIGKNGVGKTTLLKIIKGDESINSGNLKFGLNMKIGYLDQEFKDMDLKQSVMDYLWEADQKLMEHHIISNLIKFGFEKSKIHNKLKSLSGGEKTRVSLVKLMLSKCDILLLDEPTNHLDVELIESLEKALKEFSGTVIFVSHDRRFINRVAQKLFLIKNKEFEILEGNYSANF